MIKFKKIIAIQIAKIVDLNEEEIEGYIEVPPNKEMGDYAFPCFKLAKELKKAPQVIAQEIAEKIETGNEISEVKIAGGYLNFYINKVVLVENVLNEIDQTQENYGSSEIGNGKNIVIDYSHPNIAKPFHVGHLRSTVIGQALYNIYEYLGYNVDGLNYLGDYGTQFGKLIEGYKRWGNEYDIDSNPIDELTKIYVRINNLCKEDESVLEECRNNFKKLEDGDSYCVELWEKFREISLVEFKRIYDLLGGRFDSWDGEAFIAPQAPNVTKILIENGSLIESQGAKIIDLESKGINTPCIIEKSDGSTTYAVRDLAAIMYRAKTYDYDKSLYITSYEQVLHFKQVFEVAKLLGLDEKYTDGLIHVPFGMVQLKTGKMSTREGNIIKLEELLNEAITKAKEIIENKNPDLENKDEIAKKVGIGAIIFNDLSNNRIKDEIFDWDTILNFNGETGPYIQYIYVRTNSVLEKAGYAPSIKDVNFEFLTDKESIKVISCLYEFEDTLKAVLEKNEPSILARYLINLSQSYSNFYNENKIIVEDKALQDARLYLTKSVGTVLKTGCRLLGIEMPTKM